MAHDSRPTWSNVPAMKIHIAASTMVVACLAGWALAPQTVTGQASATQVPIFEYKGLSSPKPGTNPPTTVVR